MATVLVLGANGKVGQALGASEGDIAERVRAATGGHGADIVYNTVGSPYFEAANRAMAIKGRQIFFSTIDRVVPFDIFAFYRGRHRFVDIDTLALDSADGAAVLDALRPGFERGALRPFPVLPDNVYHWPARRTPTRRSSPGSASCSIPRSERAIHVAYDRKDPEIMMGKPCVKGTRTPVYVLL
jgi:hypothetical protein